MTITIAWWMLPTLITIIGIILALAYDDGGGYGSGIMNIILLLIAFGISLLSWITAALFK
jgi:hypothetical protein